MNRIIRLMIWTIPVLLAAGCSGDHAADKKADPTAAKPHFQTATVVAGGVEQLVKLPATLAAFLQVSIFPKVNGYVTDVRVDVGSHVRQGEQLMTLEAPELVQAVAQAKERYARALADYRIDRENYERLGGSRPDPRRDLADGPCHRQSKGGSRQRPRQFRKGQLANATGHDGLPAGDGAVRGRDHDPERAPGGSGRRDQQKHTHARAQTDRPSPAPGRYSGDDRRDAAEERHADFLRRRFAGSER
jgi:hypothetical protein